MISWLDEIQDISSKEEKQILSPKEVYVKCIVCGKPVHISKAGNNCLTCPLHLDRAFNGIIEFSTKAGDKIIEWKQENNKLYKMVKTNKHIWNGMTKLEANALEGSEYVPGYINLGNVRESSLNEQITIPGLDEEGYVGFDRDIDELPSSYFEWSAYVLEEEEKNNV